MVYVVVLPEDRPYLIATPSASVTTAIAIATAIIVPVSCFYFSLLVVGQRAIVSSSQVNVEVLLAKTRMVSESMVSGLVELKATRTPLQQ